MITSFNEFNNRPVIDHFALSNPMVKRPSSPINEIHAMAKYGLSEFKSLFEGILFDIYSKITKNNVKIGNGYF